MKRFIVSTNNRGKIKELYAILGKLDVELITPSEIGLRLEVAETGVTYAENAILKAKAAAVASGLVALGDDSGLEVEALKGAPGLYSARYAGEGARDADRRAKLIEALRPWPAPRPARFCCALAVVLPTGERRVFEGVCPGEMLLEERGHNGFGYDPIFYLPAYERTMAELPAEVKNQISHRARATLAALPYLQQLAQTEK